MADENQAGTTVHSGDDSQIAVDAEPSVPNFIPKDVEAGSDVLAEPPVAHIDVQEDGDEEAHKDGHEEHEDGHNMTEPAIGEGEYGTEEQGSVDGMSDMGLSVYLDSDSVNSNDIAEDYTSRFDRIYTDFKHQLQSLDSEILEKIMRKNRRKPPTKRKEDDVSNANTQEDIGSVEKEISLPPAKPGINRVNWKGFRVLCLETDGNSFAIDILEGEPTLGTDDLEPRVVQSKGSDIPGKAPLPERLRFHSKQLASILNEFNDSRRVFRENTVLLRPYRALAYFDNPLREWHNKLQAKFARKDAILSSAPSAKEGDTTDATVPAMQNEVGGDNKGEPKTSPPSSTKGTPRLDIDVGDAIDSIGEEDDSNSFTALGHLEKLIEFMDTDIAQKINYLKSAECQYVTFSDLWYLFEPGSHVISNDGKQAYRILNVRWPAHRPPRHPQERWLTAQRDEEDGAVKLSCVYVDFDGKLLGPVRKKVQIDKFEGEKDVTSLKVYPIRFHKSRILAAPAVEVTPRSEGEASLPAENGIWADLVKRGGTFLKYATTEISEVRPLYYFGPTLMTMDEVESQVVVDFEAAFAEDRTMANSQPDLEQLIGNATDRRPPENCWGECCQYEVDNIHADNWVDQKRNESYMKSLLPKSGTELPSAAIFRRPIDKTDPSKGLTDEDMAIMSYRVFGFVLRNRKWAQLDVTYLTEELPSDVRDGDILCHSDVIASNTFDRLVLPDGHANIILGLVDQHFRDKQLAGNSENHTDIVRGKGKGLIILLHGAPGVGKTTTAEGVAEKFNKPLFQITCGDLGTTAREVEAALDTNFALASRWGCILLLDEADVFLAQRTKEDFVRNGLVAVFLRVLEYYSGILFLTTNRVGDFDEAFASRIHISLYYPELDLKKTSQVFTLNLELIRARFAARDRKIETDDIEIGSFIKQYWDENPFDHWNGRQIRNACQTAVALAEYDANGKRPMVAVDLQQPVKLEVSHFKKVSDAYLEFSRYVRDIYGTHAARRAKEAGLRAMWVDNKGNVVGNIGPKSSKQTRFKLAAMGKEPVQKFPPQGSRNSGSYYPQQQQQQQQQQQSPQYLQPQPWASHGQNMGYQGQYPADTGQYGPPQPSGYSPQGPRQQQSPQPYPPQPYQGPGPAKNYTAGPYPGDDSGGGYQQPQASNSTHVQRPIPQRPPVHQQQQPPVEYNQTISGAGYGYEDTGSVPEAPY